MISQSVTLRTYLSLEAIYLAADDESKDEQDALALMDAIWNFLTTEEHAFLDSRGKLEE
jgi:hypothetical protein